MSASPDHALLLLISAPSGAGKTTLCDQLRGRESRVRYSTSCTTRPPRAGEEDGVAYYFLDEAEFRKRVEAGDFLEWAEVHGHLYGTLEKTVRDFMRQGFHVLMDVDVQGAQQLREHVNTLDQDDALRKGYVDVFISPPSERILEKRLRDRGLDDENVIALRLHNAREEMQHRDAYRYRIVNDKLEQAFDELHAIFQNECRRMRDN